MKSISIKKPKITKDSQVLHHFDEKLEFYEVKFSNVLAESAALQKISIIDSKLESCNLSAVKLTDSLWQRVEVSDSRLSGVIWYDAIIKDVSFINCKIDLANFRATKFKNVMFKDCVLTKSDWQSAQLSSVIFDTCNIDEMDVSNCSMNNVDLRSCEFIILKGLRGLAKATLSRQQLIMLAPIFADELGIIIED